MLDWLFGSKKQQQKKEDIPTLPQEDMWVYDFMKQYLISPIWKNPLLDYIEEKCFLFEDSQQNKFQYTKIFKGFVEICAVLLENIMKETGITEKTLEICIMRGLTGKQDKKIFQQILICDNFLSFKKMMVTKRKELQIAALQAANQQLGIKQDPIQAQIDAKELQRLQIEKAIAMSLAVEEKMKQKEQQELEEAIRQSKVEANKSSSPKKQHLGDLPPIVIGTNRQPKTIEGFKDDEIKLTKEIEELKIQQKEKKVEESAQERKKRLQEQWELIKKKKMQERKQELNNYVNNKQSEKKEEVSEEDLERRKNLMKRLKDQLKD